MTLIFPEVATEMILTMMDEAGHHHVICGEFTTIPRDMKEMFEMIGAAHEPIMIGKIE